MTAQSGGLDRGGISKSQNAKISGVFLVQNRFFWEIKVIWSEHVAV